MGEAGIEPTHIRPPRCDSGLCERSATKLFPHKMREQVLVGFIYNVVLAIGQIMHVRGKQESNPRPLA
jgi:hypothetical protein